MGHKLTEKTHILVIGALGVVFGDIGTSPNFTRSRFALAAVRRWPLLPKMSWGWCP